MAFVSFPPLVSVIMPTADRPQHVANALKLFEAQTYPNKELIVIDDGDKSVEPLLVGEHIVYRRPIARLPVGAKRNLACELANGEVIAHMDDDDWYAPGYLETHVENLRRFDIAVTGFHTCPFLNVETGESFSYFIEPAYAIGASLCYLRSYWVGHKFQPIQTAEDNAFIYQLRQGEYQFFDGSALMIATDHGKNTSPRDYANNQMPKLDGKALLERIGKATRRRKVA